jgi:hypothetical protein
MNMKSKGQSEIELMYYTMKTYYRETRTNSTLDPYRIGTRCEGYNAILHDNLVSTSMAITQQF